MSRTTWKETPVPAPDREELAPLARAISITGLTKSTIYREIRAGTFPKPVKRGRTSLWPVSRLHAWVNKTIAESEGASSAEQVGTE